MDAFPRKYNYNTNFALDFMMKEINSSEYTYDLPEDRIAIHPLQQRDHSKLLGFTKGNISHHHFFDLADLIPKDSSLFFNDTKVIPARLHFQKETGAQIEVFLLQSVENSRPLQLIMQTTTQINWQCTIGNLKRWKEGSTIYLEKSNIRLTAKLQNKEKGIVEFNWAPENLSFAEVVDTLGNTPLPPYLHRTAQESDKTRYQTIYSHHAGAVAAPTAGLHFTEEVTRKLQLRGIASEFLTLHVSAGTFQPIKTTNALDHVMHAEQIVINRGNIEALLTAGRKKIAVGTTAMRTMESLYWYGVKIIQGGDQPFIISQNDPYKREEKGLPTANEALKAVLNTIPEGEVIIGQTSIFIVPGYQFRVCEGLITNFHQPGSTLILLVAAFVGESWGAIYKEALHKNYRFLSYGDSSLLLP